MANKKYFCTTFLNTCCPHGLACYVTQGHDMESEMRVHTKGAIEVYLLDNKVFYSLEQLALYTVIALDVWKKRDKARWQ